MVITDEELIIFYRSRGRLKSLQLIEDIFNNVKFTPFKRYLATSFSKYPLDLLLNLKVHRALRSKDMYYMSSLVGEFLIDEGEINTGDRGSITNFCPVGMKEDLITSLQNNFEKGLYRAICVIAKKIYVPLSINEKKYDNKRRDLKSV